MEIKFSSEKFKSPDLRFMPVYSWVWNAPLDKDTIKNQIDDMLSAGIKAFYIIPEPPQFRPSSMVTTLSPEYLSDEFMDYIKYAFEYAQSNNMRVWIYDEGGWPSGSACGLVTKKDKSTRQKCLKAFKFELHAGEKYSAAENAVSAFDNGKKRIYDGEIISNDTWVTEYRREYVSDFRVDISEKNTTEVFIETTHEKYKSAVSEFFGKSVDYLFTDEPTCAMPAFPIGFERNFSEKYGYDICDYLYAIVGDNDNYSAFEKRVRADYGILIGELICSRCIEESRRWSHKNKIGFTGHPDLATQLMGGIYRGYGHSLDTQPPSHTPGLTEL